MVLGILQPWRSDCASEQDQARVEVVCAVEFIDYSARGCEGDTCLGYPDMVSQPRASSAVVPANKSIICTNSSCTSFWLSSGSSKECSSLLTHEKLDNLLPSQRPEPARGAMLGRQEPREEVRWGRAVGMGGNPSPQGSARP